MIAAGAMGISDSVAIRLRGILRAEESAERPPGEGRTLVDDAVDDSLGPYDLKRVIGAGGMGTVYRAVDRATGAPLAVKVPHAGTFPFTTRFERESWFARALGQLGDAPYLDHGVTSDGTPFLAMPLLEGNSLAACIAEKALVPSEALRIGERIAHVLARLHRRGAIHRDVKPANVLLDGTGAVWLVDLGLTGGPETELPGAGTPAYAAPEQLAGEEVSSTADVFALGVTLIEALTGTRVRSAGYGTVAPSGIETAARGIEPVELRDLLRRMLDSRPRERPSNGDVVACALARIRTLGELALGAQAWRETGLLPRLPFVGRAADLARLEMSLDNHAEAWIVGPSGIGKSRLVVEFWRRRAARGEMLAWTELAQPVGPLEAAWHWLRAAAGLRGGERGTFRRLAVQELARAVADAQSAADLDHPDRAGAAIFRILEAIAIDNGLVIVTTHAERIDPESARLLQALRARAGRSLATIYLSESRPGDRAVTLLPLHRSAMDELVSQMDDHEDATAAAFRAGGHPLAFQALLREPSAKNPDDALRRLIETTDPYARWLLKIASLCGPRFDAETLLQVVGGCDGPVLRDGLARLAESRLVLDLSRELGSATGSFRFAHPLLARIARTLWTKTELALGPKVLAAIEKRRDGLS